MRRRLFLLLFFACTSAECLAQAPDRRLEFDVASVRENKSGGQPASNIPLDRGNAYRPTGGVLSATNQSFLTLLIFAYKVNITEFMGGLMRSLPKWVTADKFDVDARAASETSSKDDLRLMMQSLLEDRFGLKVHRQTQSVPSLPREGRAHGNSTQTARCRQTVLRSIGLSAAWHTGRRLGRRLAANVRRRH